MDRSAPPSDAEEEAEAEAEAWGCDTSETMEGLPLLLLMPEAFAALADDAEAYEEGSLLRFFLSRLLRLCLSLTQMLYARSSRAGSV